MPIKFLTSSDILHLQSSNKHRNTREMCFFLTPRSSGRSPEPQHLRKASNHHGTPTALKTEQGLGCSGCPGRSSSCRRRRKRTGAQRPIEGSSWEKNEPSAGQGHRWGWAAHLPRPAHVPSHLAGRAVRWASCWGQSHGGAWSQDQAAGTGPVPRALGEPQGQAPGTHRGSETGRVVGGTSVHPARMVGGREVGRSEQSNRVGTCVQLHTFEKRLSAWLYSSKIMHLQRTFTHTTVCKLTSQLFLPEQMLNSLSNEHTDSIIYLNIHHLADVWMAEGTDEP